MKALVAFSALILCFATCLVAQENPQPTSTNRWEAGVFADGFRLSRVSPHVTFVGVGGRVGRYFGRRFALEAEVSYDFERHFNTVYSNGFTNINVNTPVHLLHGLGGPRFDITTGRLRLFGEFKAGFVQFGPFTQNPASGFTNTIGEVTTGQTHTSLYPGGGAEVTFGRLGLRFDIGDDLYFAQGKHWNPKATFGPTFRF